MSETQNCPFCHGTAWYLDYAGGGTTTPSSLELIPCVEPDCDVSDRPIEHLAVNLAGFGRADERGGVVMALGRDRDGM